MVALAGELDVGDGFAEGLGSFGEGAGLGDGDAPVVGAVSEEEGGGEALDVGQRAAVAHAGEVGGDGGVAGLEHDPVGDVGLVVEALDVGEAGVGEAEAEGVAVVAVVGGRREGQGAHGGVAAVAAAVDADLPGAEAEAALGEAGDVEEVDDLVAAEVAVVEGLERPAEAVAAPHGGGHDREAGGAHDVVEGAVAVLAAVEGLDEGELAGAVGERADRSQDEGVELAGFAAHAVEGGDLHRLGAALDDLRGEGLGQGDHALVVEAGGLAVAGGEGGEVGLEHEVGGLLRPHHAAGVAVDDVGLAALGLLAEGLAGAGVDEGEARAHR